MIINYKLSAIGQNKGFIALTSVVIISAVIVLLMVGIFRGSVGEMWRGAAKERGEQAFSLANLCMEIALNELRENPDTYTGGGIFEDFEEGECEILPVVRNGDIIITTKGKAEIEGRITTYTRRIEAEVSVTASGLEINSWKETE